MAAPERIASLNDRPPQGGRFVLYWMQAAQRASRNAALQYAVARARDLGLPVLAVFGLAPFPDATARAYGFMLEGLAETERDLAGRGIQLVVRREDPPGLVASLAAEAALVVVDVGYLRIQRRWRAGAAERCPCPVVAVEDEVVVPTSVLPAREEWAARTLRPRITRHLDAFLRLDRDSWPRRDSLAIRVPGEAVDLSDHERCFASLELDAGDDAKRSLRLRGGASEARRLLRRFVERRLARYHLDRSDPGLDCQSGLGPYLHFGQISPREAAVAARDAGHAPEEARGAFLEELIVRRELSANFCLRNAQYDSWACLPEWARSTLEAHSGDPRPERYTRADLVGCRTRDELWNAAMREMLLTGKMHNYMRMYWGKKLLEWTADPREAFAAALELNNRYSLDGRDPNSFAGVAWCFGKHDQAWKERPIYGKVRYMSSAGLERKFDMAAYVDRVARLAAFPDT